MQINLAIHLSKLDSDKQDDWGFFYMLYSWTFLDNAIYIHIYQAPFFLTYFLLTQSEELNDLM